MTNSEDQRLNGSLDRYFIIQRQKLGKYVGNYGTEDAFLTCYKSRPIHPILTQIGARKHPKLDKQAICVNSYCILSIPPTIQIFRPAAPTRGVSVPYFQAKCHFVLSNVTVRAKTIFLTQQQSVQLSQSGGTRRKLIFGQENVLSDSSCPSALQHFRLMLETENRKIYQELWARKRGTPFYYFQKCLLLSGILRIGSN